MPSAWEWFETAAEHLSRFGHRWCRTGALAALDYRSVPRMTTDADLLVEWSEELVGHLESAGYQLRIYADPGEPPHLLINRSDDLGNVDFIVAGTEYQDLALDRAVANGRVLTVEDVLVHKLIAWRKKDRDDIRSILEAGHRLDLPYIEHWAREWSVDDRWAEAGSWLPK